MDWYSWLSSSGLNPSLVSDYSLLFAHNELEEEDIAYFDHEFLQSMGISIAKHRLEILKLAKTMKRRRGGRGRNIAPPRPVARLLSTVADTKKSLSRYFHTLFDIGRCDSSALVAVPTPAYATAGPRWRGTMLNRRKKKKGQLVRLMITDGDGKVARPKPNSVSHSSSPVVCRGPDNKGGEEIRWDSMFHNLNPT